MNCENNSSALNQTKRMIRGDTKAFKFRRKNHEHETIHNTPESLYFTIKTNFKTESYLFQKKLDNMYKTEDGYWHFRLNPEDTESLDYGKYCWDIEVIQGGFKTTISRGYLELLNEATWKANE